MDPSLMTAEELEARGRVVVDPCARCHHNRQSHVYIPRPDSETGSWFPAITACLFCGCPEFIATMWDYDE